MGVTGEGGRWGGGGEVRQKRGSSPQMLIKKTGREESADGTVR